jgi:hypothetical protein
VRSIVVEVAAYAGAAMGLVGTFVLVATTVQPTDATLLLVTIAVTAVLFAAGIAIRTPHRRTSGCAACCGSRPCSDGPPSWKGSWSSRRSISKGVRASCSPRS